MPLFLSLLLVFSTTPPPLGISHNMKLLCCLVVTLFVVNANAQACTESDAPIFFSTTNLLECVQEGRCASSRRYDQYVLEPNDVTCEGNIAGDCCLKEEYCDVTAAAVIEGRSPINLDLVSNQSTASDFASANVSLYSSRNSNPVIVMEYFGGDDVDYVQVDYIASTFEPGTTENVYDALGLSTNIFFTTLFNPGVVFSPVTVFDSSGNQVLSVDPAEPLFITAFLTYKRSDMDDPFVYALSRNNPNAPLQTLVFDPCTQTECDQGCVDSYGYWKNDAPRDELDFTPFTRCNISAEDIFKRSARFGDAVTIVARQALAARYNEQREDVCPDDADLDLIDDLEEALCDAWNLDLTARDPDDICLRREVLRLAGLGEQFNEGIRSVSSCDPNNTYVPDDDDDDYDYDDDCETNGRQRYGASSRASRPETPGKGGKGGNSMHREVNAIIDSGASRLVVSSTVVSLLCGFTVSLFT